MRKKRAQRKLKPREQTEAERIIVASAGNGEEADMQAIEDVMNLHPHGPEIVCLLDDKNPDVQVLAARCLLQLPYSRTIEELHPLVEWIAGFRIRRNIDKASQVGGFYSKWLMWCLIWLAIYIGIVVYHHIPDNQLSDWNAEITKFVWALALAPLVSFLCALPRQPIWIPLKYRRSHGSGSECKPGWSMAAINRLLALSVDKESGIQQQAIAELDSVILLLRQADSSLIRHDAKLAMGLGAQSYDDEDIPAAFRLKLVRALELVGDRAELPALHRVESCSDETDEIREAARNAIRSIETRTEKELAREILLRPSESPEPTALLRPASGATVESEALLHIPLDG